MASFNDIIGVPVVLIFFAVFFYWVIPYFIKDKLKKQLFYIGLCVKIMGVAASFLFYTFIEKHADTQPFFIFGKSISNILSEYPFRESMKVFYTDFYDLPLQMKSLFYSRYTSEIYADSSVIIRIAGIFLYLTFNSYIACSIIFSFFDISGVG